MKPTGNVTFFFTDIEGSTKLSQEYPDYYPDALKLHNSILHKAIEIYNGFVFKTVGDAFCCAFGNADDAVNAAVDVQKRLNSENWNEAVIKVRIGIHSGKSEWNGTDYMGYITLARVQRIMSAACGGQIIISKDAYEILTLKDSDDISFRDFGERRLKDLIHPMKLFQVSSKEIASDFPPLKTLDARPNNLPVQLTSFIGREESMKELKNLLGQSRLMTIIGSGGVGKTRLAMQTGADMIDDFSNGVFITELATVSDSSLVVQTILNILEVKEEQGMTPGELLKSFLKDKELLLILDNCEHLINECAVLAEGLLSKCPKLKIIATSREYLNCSGEQTYRVPSLSYPDTAEKESPAKLSHYESVRLFIERALSLNPNFRVNINNASALAEICSRLEGIPLAIELAAARSNVLSVEKIQERLVDRFKFLNSGKRTALPRQQTLKAMIDWSYDLLSEKEKILWNRLSVFNGGWKLDAAENITSDDNISKEEIFDLLSNLADKSIIIFNSEKNRYMILETIKQYGKEKLKAAEEEDIYRSNHLKYFAELSNTAEPKLIESEMQIWLEKLESEHGNLQAAILWATGYGSIEEGARLAGTMGRFWEIHGYYSIGIRLLESILELNNVQEVSKSATAKVLSSLGILSRNLGEFEQAQKSFKESLVIYREIEDKYGIVNSLNNLGIVAADQGNYEQSQKFLEESLLSGREIEDKCGIADSLINLGTIEYHQGNYEHAEKYYQESLKLRRGIGNKPGIAMCLNNLGSLASRQLDSEQAQKLYNESLTISREIGDKTGIGMCLNNLGGLESDMGNYEQAQNLYQESLAIWRQLGDKLGIVMTLNNLGILENIHLNYKQAHELYNESLIIGREIGDKVGIVHSLIGLSGVLCACNELPGSVKLLGAVNSALKSLSLKLLLNKFNFQKRILNELHEKLSDEEFSKYFEEGKKLTLEEAGNTITNYKLLMGN